MEYEYFLPFRFIRLYFKCKFLDFNKAIEQMEKNSFDDFYFQKITDICVDTPTRYQYNFLGNSISGKRLNGY